MWSRKCRFGILARMSEFGEPIAGPASHSPGLKECPFCPEEEPRSYTTYSGSANKSGVLEDVMVKPSLLISKQGGARPKNGEKDQQSPSAEQPKPSPIYTSPDHGPCSVEAHHLISGKQALKNSPIEQWLLVSKDRIERDTGYSVNNADNGFWAPSIPERYKGGAWGPKSYEEKLAIACEVMAATQRQFHKSHHAISDPDDPGGEVHPSYDSFLKDKLMELNDRIEAWSTYCSLCKPDKKPQPSVTVNQLLDNLSTQMRNRVSGPRAGWEVFLSQYALAYHQPVCTHRSERL
jgi:A nuclease family of the HNH/ENDO VII superfamily with conserved AHH